MGTKTTTLSSLGEPLFLGLSCLVGGEQFYILLYGSEVSIRAQSSVLVVTAVITCILSSAMSSKADILANSFHLFYMSVLVLLMIIRNEVTSRGIVTVTTIALGYALTVLVIQSCSLYSTSRQELLSFILGLFSARYLPSFFRHFVSKSASNDAQIRSVSRALGISRLLFCILSLALKVLMGRFQLTFTETISVKHIEKNQWKQELKGFWTKINELLTIHLINSLYNIINLPEKGFLRGFKQIWNHIKFWFDFSVLKPSAEYNDYLRIYFFSMPILTFITSVIIFLMYPRTRFSAYCGYSQKLLSTIMNVKMTCHIVGSLLGIGYPMSVTSNSILYSIIHLLFYYSLILMGSMSKHDDIKSTHKFLFFMSMDCFVLGYIWSYNLGLVINMVLRETCVYEEVETFKKHPNSQLKINKNPCCGDKFVNECYCKMKPIKIIDSGIGYSRILYFNKLDCTNKEITYSKDGKCAILLINGSDCQKDCEGSCTESNCNGNCCLKIIGKYKLEAVTVSSCSDCQLTIRLEGTCCCGTGQCEKCCGTGGPCGCETGKCCCLCVKCCNPSCGGRAGCCCCIHYCNKGGACSCNCNNANSDSVRVFICYKVKENCCIKEIRPNERADFVGDLSSKDVFDIQDILISHCCHVDIRVDLRCAVKNNYFRLSGANYPRKFERPDLVSLLWSESVCCPTPPPAAQCCCMFRSLVRGCLLFIGSSWKSRNIKGCTVACRCAAGSKCCVTPCDLPVDASGGFVKRVNRIRVKLIVIAWLMFAVVFFIVALIVSAVNKKYSPRSFCPVTSYSKLAGALVTNKYNSDEQVTRRMVGLVENGKISEEVMEEKKKELKAMISMFAKYTSSQDKITNKPMSGISKLIKSKHKPKEVDKIRDHIVTKAARFTPSSSVSGGRRFDPCLVEWSQCVGLVYKYAMPLFFVIQQFFVDWEEAWRIDLRNYRRQIMPYFMRVTHKSKVSLSTVMSESNVGDKCNQSGLNRLGTWNHAFREVKQLSTVTLKEDAVSEESIPLKIGNRLHYYLSRWNHRLANIRAWCSLESCLFDWSGFLNEYGRITKWIADVSPGLRCDSEVKVSTKDLNRGIQIFVASK